jgi:methionyl-tRNA formyltransferase
MSEYKIIIFGGNRLLENGPLSELCFFLKKNKIKFLVITDILHFKKKINQNESFGSVLKKKNYEYIIARKLNYNFLKKNVKKNVTIGFSINCIWKFNEKIINLFKGRLYNYHAADLPTERGAANITWRILLKKKKQISINIHEVSKDYDTGPIVKSKKIAITKNEKFPFDHLQIIQKIENSFLKKFLLDCLAKKKFFKTKQLNYGSFYWPKINSDIDGLINWNWNADEIIDFIRGFSKPYNGAFTFLKGKKIRIFDANKLKFTGKFHPFQNGIIFRKDKNFLYVAARKYIIKISFSNILGLNKIENFYLGKRFSNK